MQSDAHLDELKMDAAELYREEVFSDLRIGTIRRLTPVTPDGSDDPARQVLYVGQAQIYTPAGALPLNFELDARSLDEAVQKFAAAAKESLDRTMEELKEMRRDAASQIVIPEGGAGGLPGGGKIQF